MASPITFGIVGAAWRAEFYLRVAQARPDLFQVTGVVTGNPQRIATVRQFSVQTFDSIAAMLSAARPMFVVTSVPWSPNPDAIIELVKAGLPVLSETPPASTLQIMTDLVRAVGPTGKVQVAEQCHLQPHHAARLNFIATGKLGPTSHAHVSVAHGYHGISLIRRFLGIRFENARITGQQFKASIVEGPGRAGPPAQERIIETTQTILTFDFGDRLGISDFVGDLYFSPIRGQRVLIRGQRGEIIDHRATYLKTFTQPIRVEFIRHEAGPNGNLEGHYLKGIQAGESWVYENPLAPARLSDDEIAVGTCLLKMAHYIQTGEDFYSLAEACQDMYLDLVAQQAIREQRPQQTQHQLWAQAH